MKPRLPFAPGDLVRTTDGPWNMYELPHRSVLVGEGEVMLCLRVEEPESNPNYPEAQRLRVQFVRCEFAWGDRVVWASNPETGWDFLEAVR